MKTAPRAATAFCVLLLACTADSFGSTCGDLLNPGICSGGYAVR